MIEQLPFIFFILLVLWGIFGQVVVQSPVLNSFIYATMFTLAIHAPYISTPIAKGWEWIEAIPWVLCIVYGMERRIKDYFEKFEEVDANEH